MESLVAAVGSSSLTRDGTWTPCIRSWSLSYWTTREGPEEDHLREKEGAQGDKEEGVPFYLLFELYV